MTLSLIHAAYVMDAEIKMSYFQRDYRWRQGI